MSAPVPYARFCADRQTRWEHHARLVERPSGPLTFDDIERLVALQHAIVSDLSAARTWFPNTRATHQLARQAVMGARALRPPPPPIVQRVRSGLSAWPRAVRSALPAMVTSGLVFGLGVTIGALLARQSDAAALAFVGEEALTAVQNGELWTDSVAFEAPPAVLAAAIALNNAAVGLTAWASGVLAGTGSLYVVLTNGLMVGTLFSMAARYHLFDRILAFTAAHGPLELTLIVFCGGAGLAFARGMLRDDGRDFRTRTADAASTSLLLVLGAVPGFFLLGAVEGFISPNMAVPTAAKAVLGMLLLAVFVVYVAVGGRRERAPTRWNVAEQPADGRTR